MMNFPASCKACGRQLFGPVRFCPFCGKDIVSLDESVSPLIQEIEKPVEPTHAVPHSVDIVSPPLAADAKGKETVTSEPAPAKESPPVEQPTVSKQEPAKKEMPQTASPRVLTAVTGDSKELKKSRTGLFIALVIAAVVVIVVAIKFMPGSSTSVSSATVAIKSSPAGALVTIDGTEAGKTPITSVKVSEGSHTLVFNLSGYQSRMSEVSLVKGNNPDVMVTLVNVSQPKGVKTAPSQESPATAPSVKSPSVEKTTKTPPVKVPSPQSVPAVQEKPLEERIQEGISLYEKGNYKEATKRFKSILDVVPNNSVAKFYLGKSVEAETKDDIKQLSSKQKELIAIAKELEALDQASNNTIDPDRYRKLQQYRNRLAGEYKKLSVFLQSLSNDAK